MEKELLEEISEILKRLGIAPDKNGYHYLRKAIFECYNNPMLLTRITKGIYPTVAEAFGTRKENIERCIRTAIETGWTRGDYEFSNELFGYCVDYEKAKSTNGEFISIIVDDLLLKYNKINA